MVNVLVTSVQELLSQLSGVKNKRDLVLVGDDPWEYVTSLF
jgi:hypothetical protein